MTDKLYTLAEVARRTRISRQTLYTAIKVGYLSPKRIGYYACFTERDIKELQARTTTSTTIDGRRQTMIDWDMV